MYLCDDSFHTEILWEQLADHGSEQFGFVVVDGNGASWFCISGNAKRELFKMEVSLPGKHSKGGQSSQRFARIREEKRLCYFKKVAEATSKCFLTADGNTVNVRGIIVAGAADIKHNVVSLLHPKIKKAVLKVIDIQYGGNPGFHEALEACRDTLQGHRLMREIDLFHKFFESVAQDGPVCYGIQDTMYALEMGAVETLILWDGFRAQRYQLQNTKTTATKVVYLSANPSPGDDADDDTHATLLSLEQEDGWQMSSDPGSQTDLLEWLLEHRKEKGCSLELVGDATTEGTQFSRGFGGIGAICRYRVDSLPSVAVELEGEDESGAELLSEEEYI